MTAHSMCSYAEDPKYLFMKMTDQGSILGVFEPRMKKTGITPFIYFPLFVERATPTGASRWRVPAVHAIPFACGPLSRLRAKPSIKQLTWKPANEKRVKEETFSIFRSEEAQRGRKLCEACGTKFYPQADAVTDLNMVEKNKEVRGFLFIRSINL